MAFFRASALAAAAIVGRRNEMCVLCPWNNTRTARVGLGSRVGLAFSSDAHLRNFCHMSPQDKATTERNARTLRELVKRPDNRTCADCKHNGVLSIFSSFIPL
jgi:hypothetical protein